MKKSGVILTGERMERLVNSPSTLDPARAKRLRYRIKRNMDGAIDDLIRIMDGRDPRLAAYAAECIRSRLLDSAGMETAAVEDGMSSDTVDEIEDEMWG